MRVCGICDEEPMFRVTIKCGRFTHINYYCIHHKPQSIVVEEGLTRDKDRWKIIELTNDEIEDLKDRVKELEGRDC